MVTAEMNLPELIEAPLKKGEELGELRLTLDGEVISRTPLVVLADAPEAGFFSRMWQSVVLFFQDLISGD
jgi:D-alanyl-D-alanine carboxypeptidase (penicillin-binding protein 5/6)